VAETSGPWPIADASELEAMSDQELIEAASKWTQHTKFEMELQRRSNLGQVNLTAAIHELKAAADRSSQRQIWLTVALVVLTVVLTVLTLVLVLNPPS